jgi:hypothetical protein
MSKEKQIAIALKSRLSTVVYSGSPVKFYDMVRDDAEQVQIFISAMVCEDMSTKSTELHQVTLMLGVREIFDGVITGKETINDIGDQVETLLASDLAISGWFTVEQHLKRTQFTEISDRDRNEIIKTYIYNLIIQKDG